MKKLSGLLKALNSVYRSSLSLFTGPEFSPNIFHPQFLIQFYMKRNLRSASRYISGLLLDLGCGTKPYVEIFSSNCKGYFGMDSSGFRRPEFFVTRNGLSPDILGNICRLPFKNGSADTVLCTQVLEHLRQPDQAIAEIKQVLRSGGILIASVPQAYPLHDKTNDYYRFTSLGIRYLLEDNGFEVLDIMRHGGFFVERALMSNIYSNYNLFREGEGVGFMRLCLSLLKVVLTPALLLINAVNNISGLILNCFDPDHDFTHNYTVIARRN